MMSARLGSSDEPPMFCVGVGILPDAVAVFRQHGARVRRNCFTSLKQVPNRRKDTVY